MIALRAAVARRLDPKSDRGVSLTELIVTIAITSVVMTIVGAMFINVAGVSATSNATTTRSSIAANVMNEMSDVIRTSANNPITSETSDPAVVSATESALTVYSYVDTIATAPAPSKVTFRIDSAGTVFEDRILGTKNSSGYWVYTGSTVTRNLGGPVATAGLFVYLDSTGATVVPAASGLTAIQRATVTAITVTVTIANTNTKTAATDPVIITNTVGMPNLKIPGSDE